MIEAISPIALIPLAAALVVATLAVSVWRQATPSLRLLLVSIGAWSALYSAEIALPGLSAKLWAAKIAYVPIALTPLATLLVAREIAGHREFRWWWALPAALTVPLVFTNDLHQLVWSSVAVARGAVPALAVTYGPVFHAFNATAQLMLAFSLYSTQALFQGQRSAQGLWIGAGLSAPWLANAAYVSGLVGVPGLDPTPIAFGLTAFALSRGLLQPGPLRGLIDSIGNEIVERLADAVFVATDKGDLLYANAAARRLVGCSSDAAPEHVFRAVATIPELLEVLAGDRDDESQISIDVGGTRCCYDPRLSLIGADSSATRRIVSLRDVTRERIDHERIQELAYYDELTKLPNRGRFLQLLEAAIRRAANRGDDAALLFIDIDRFKSINDSFGHAAGDSLLQEVARRVADVVRFNDPLGRPTTGSKSAVSRLGGDEFTIILTDIAHPKDAGRVAVRCIRALGEPFPYDGHQLHVGASIGIALAPSDGRDAASLLRRADLAMYAAKRSGGSGFAFFSADMDAAVHLRTESEERLRRAIDAEEFTLAFQPIRDVTSGELMEAEVLLRWQCDGEPVLPLDFIPIAEEVGLIHPLGDWVLESTLGWIRSWQRKELCPPRISINISGLQLVRSGFPDRVDTLLTQAGVSSDAIALELTETALQIDEEPARLALAKLKEQGISLALDDFGTGTSSLAHLQRDEFETVKIDRSFLTAVPQTERGCALVRAVVDLAHGLGLRVVAEGIDREEQVHFLNEVGCDLAQGYLFAKPMPAEDFEQLLEREKR